MKSLIVAIIMLVAPQAAYAYACVPPDPECNAEQRAPVRLTDQNRACLATATYADMNGRTNSEQIESCNIPEAAIPQAMNFIVSLYRSSHFKETSWVTGYCSAETAYPRNKLVCIYRNVTMTYQ